MTRMFERLGKGQLALGLWAMTPGPELVEIIGYVGMDFVIVDMMATTMGFETVENMVRAAKLYNMTPLVRLQAYPWDNSQFDPRAPSEASRALSTGAEGVLMSVDSPEMVAALMPLAREYHREIWLEPLRRQRGERFQPQIERLQSHTLIIPVIESLGALERIDKILSVEGLRAIFLGTGDLARVMGHPGDTFHPEMRALYQKIVSQAKEKGIMTILHPHA
ncbi:MAG: aldolase/citrate lyase family protein, partial [Chloroflexota bacterium]|nr:aldolase/citrate lyase family protein [Chloroflexota bacterium]